MAKAGLLSGSGSDGGVLWASSETLTASVDAWATGQVVVPGGQKCSLAWAADSQAAFLSHIVSEAGACRAWSKASAQLPRGPHLLLSRPFTTPAICPFMHRVSLN